jgi:mRNA interferase RelE/StbE
MVQQNERALECYYLNPLRLRFGLLRISPPKQFRQLWLKVLGLSDSQKLKGYDFHRVDFGEYRIVYEANDTTLTLILIGKRNDDEVYKQLGRLP